MPKNVDSLNGCIDNILKGYTEYDRTVDVVSGFEAFFNNSDYNGHLIYFDRFPRISSPQKLTPDFTVLFNNYGLIFEITKGIAKEKDDKPLEKKLRQLLKYDSKLEFKSDDENNKVIPEIQDIVLILDVRDANEAFVRINQKIEENSEFEFKNNLILLDYNFIPEDCCYSLRKFAGKNRCFRDGFLPEDIQLEKNMGTMSKSLRFYPKHFMLQKSKSNLCNDQPTDLYMSVYLWSRILYNYLDANQRAQYQKGSSRIKQYINLNIDVLVKDINNKYIKNGNVHTTWIKDAMKFLEKANLAEFTSRRDVTIHYHNLQKGSLSKRRYGSEAASEHDGLYELAKLIAQRHCYNLQKGRNKTKTKSTKSLPPRPKQLFRQLSLYDI
ncbi:MAG: hypothetical protein WC628_10480 [Candidatus Omnitrophota bacterium]